MKGTNPAFMTAHNAGNPDFLGMVVEKAPFNSTPLRQAIAWAVDKEAILKVAYFGVGDVGSQEVGSGNPYYTTNDPYKGGPDLNKAQQLLKAAGYGSGLTFEYLGLPQYPELLKTGEIVKEQLSQIGITMNITQLEVTVWVDRLVKRNYQMTSIYAAGTVDPDPFYSNELQATGRPISPVTRIQNSTRLFCRRVKNSNPSQRKALYAKVRQNRVDGRAICVRALRDAELCDEPQGSWPQAITDLAIVFQERLDWLAGLHWRRTPISEDCDVPNSRVCRAASALYGADAARHERVRLCHRPSGAW